MALGYEKEVKRQLTRAQIERRERRKQRMLGAGMEGKVALHAAMSKKVDAKPEARKLPTNLSIAYFRKKADEKRRAAAAKRVTEAGRRAAAPVKPVYPIHKTLKRESEPAPSAPVVPETVKPVVKTTPEASTAKIIAARKRKQTEIIAAREARTAKIIADRKRKATEIIAAREARTAKIIAARKRKEAERIAARKRKEAERKTTTTTTAQARRRAVAAAENEAAKKLKREREEKIIKTVKGAGAYIGKGLTALGEWGTERKQKLAADRATTSRWLKLSRDERKKWGSIENFKQGSPTAVAGLKKGGLVKKSVATKISHKKFIAKKPSRKKSIDGIARKGHTKAPHK
jgi:hypothetical protein